jgi:hypothetical protein
LLQTLEAPTFTDAQDALERGHGPRVPASPRGLH